MPLPSKAQPVVLTPCGGLPCGTLKPIGCVWCGTTYASWKPVGELWMKRKARPSLVPGDAGARGEEWLGVFLVLNLAEPGGTVGVRDLEGLKVVEVETAALDSEGEVAGERGFGVVRFQRGRRL